MIRETPNRGWKSRQLRRGFRSSLTGVGLEFNGSTPPDAELKFRGPGEFHGKQGATRSASVPEQKSA
ncbi:MAG: hypothetical protein B7Z55_13245 [Planctomycetales bacterium 12-60-4]|nr:MAG: hypothetical protein B7Z55_13245 [Planctomycetales bacterium 12-60-4]